MLAVTRVDDMTLPGGPLTVMEEEEDVVSRLRHLQRTLQECSRKVNRVDLALQARNPPLQLSNDSKHQSYVDSTSVGPDNEEDTDEGINAGIMKEDSEITITEYPKEDIEEENTEGINAGIMKDSETTITKYPKEDIKETRKGITMHSLALGRIDLDDTITGDDEYDDEDEEDDEEEEEDTMPCTYPEIVSQEEGDNAGCVGQRVEGKEQQGTSTTLLLQYVSDEEDEGESGESIDKQRPPLLRHARVEIENTDYAETITIEPFALDLLGNDKHIMSTDLMSNTCSNSQLNVSDNNVGKQTLFEQDETKQEATQEFIDAGECNTGSWKMSEILTSENESSDRGDTEAEDTKKEDMSNEQRRSTYGKHSDSKHNLMRVFEEQDIPLENTPEIPHTHPDQRQTSPTRVKQMDSSLYRWPSLMSQHSTNFEKETDPQLISSEIGKVPRLLVHEARHLPESELPRTLVTRSISKEGTQLPNQANVQKDKGQGYLQWSHEFEKEDFCFLPDLSHPQQVKNMRLLDKKRMYRASSLERLLLAGGKKSMKDDDWGVVAEHSKEWDDTTAKKRALVCDYCKVNKPSNSKREHLDPHQYQQMDQGKMSQQAVNQQELSQQSFNWQRLSQEIRSSLAAVVIVFLLLCLLLFLSCWLMLVVPVVTVSVKTYGGSPAF
ncbi:hypothetical protein Pmani_012792 [Petrolisthes manimaculis]|uniref:Uncharacterized protein n=1 Tax=Petrolisthes manimaculis TaxID=1843537 RepID=A0AAE1PX34_9EUCA|nr:hypothetical protein Pmani_012792 [Petrolisthes manimaculis]